MKKVFQLVERNIDRLAEDGVSWSLPATSEQMENAWNGRLEIPFSPKKQIPENWLGDLHGKKVLCLAGGGGLQAPLLACAGADVTVFDLSQRMLDRDRATAVQAGLHIRIEHGNMCDLGRFEDGSFDLVLNPPSLFYVPDVLPVFREVHRVLKPGGRFIMISFNPIAYICDYDEQQACYKAVNRMPYRSMEHMEQGDWVEYGHTMQSYLGGQIECGFVLTGYMESQMEDITELYFMTMSEKR